MITGVFMEFRIYWEDLTEEAKERLKPIWHENIHLSPIAIIEVELEALTE